MHLQANPAVPDLIRSGAISWRAVVGSVQGGGSVRQAPASAPARTRPRSTSAVAPRLASERGPFAKPRSASRPPFAVTRMHTYPAEFLGTLFQTCQNTEG